MTKQKKLPLSQIPPPLKDSILQLVRLKDALKLLTVNRQLRGYFLSKAVFPKKLDELKFVLVDEVLPDAQATYRRSLCIRFMQVESDHIANFYTLLINSPDIETPEDGASVRKELYPLLRKCPPTRALQIEWRNIIHPGQSVNFQLHTELFEFIPRNIYNLTMVLNNFEYLRMLLDELNLRVSGSFRPIIANYLNEAPEVIANLLEKYPYKYELLRFISPTEEHFQVVSKAKIAQIDILFFIHDEDGFSNWCNLLVERGPPNGNGSSRIELSSEGGITGFVEAEELINRQADFQPIDRDSNEGRQLIRRTKTNLREVTRIRFFKRTQHHLSTYAILELRRWFLSLLFISTSVDHIKDGDDLQCWTSVCPPDF